MRPDELAWLAVMRIWRELGGPRPPLSVLVRHQGDSTAEPSTADPDTLREARRNEAKRWLRRYVEACEAIGRHKLAGRIRLALAVLGEDEARIRRNVRRGRIRVWKAPDTGMAVGGA